MTLLKGWKKKPWARPFQERWARLGLGRSSNDTLRRQAAASGARQLRGAAAGWAAADAPAVLHRLPHVAVEHPAESRKEI